MINQERLVNEFLELIRIDSPSRKEGAVAAVLIRKLHELGLEVQVDEQSAKQAGCETGNLHGYLKGEKKDIPALLFSAHMDTVMPGEKINPNIEDGVISSDGSTILGSDDKSGIAAILEAIRHIQEDKHPHGDIEVLFTIGEEIGLLGSKHLDYGLLKAEIGFVLDSGGQPGTIINQGPAQDQITAVIHGKAAHAGFNPQDGISAIQAAAKAIDRMKLLRIDEETTANIGIISGGTATNIVTDYVEIKGEARSLSEGKLDSQSRHMADCLEKACAEIGARLELSIDREYTAFHVPEDAKVIKLARKAANDLQLPAALVSTGGGSDVNIFNTRGISTVNLGTGMSKVHTKEEFIKVDDLVTMAKFVAAIILTAARVSN